MILLARTGTAGAGGVDEGSQCGVRGGVAFVLRVATGAGLGVAGGVGGVEQVWKWKLECGMVELEC